MAGLKTYYDFGENDYKYALAILDSEKMEENFRAIVISTLTQSCEKFLKHIIQINTDGDTKEDYNLLHSHNLYKLYKRVSDFANISTTKSELVWLNEFYFAARCPGDYEFTTTEEDLNKALSIVNKIKLHVDNYLNEYETLVKRKKEELGLVKDKYKIDSLNTINLFSKRDVQ